ncbi:hypothetical protein IAT38_007021 [Cryptococcus sp. DSM 104549]
MASNRRKSSRLAAKQSAAKGSAGSRPRARPPSPAVGQEEDEDGDPLPKETRKARAPKPPPGPDDTDPHRRQIPKPVRGDPDDIPPSLFFRQLPQDHELRRQLQWSPERYDLLDTDSWNISMSPRHYLDHFVTDLSFILMYPRLVPAKHDKEYSSWVVIGNSGVNFLIDTKYLEDFREELGRHYVIKPSTGKDSVHEGRISVPAITIFAALEEIGCPEVRLQVYGHKLAVDIDNALFGGPRHSPPAERLPRPPIPVIHDATRRRTASGQNVFDVSITFHTTSFLLFQPYVKHHAIKNPSILAPFGRDYGNLYWEGWGRGKKTFGKPWLLGGKVYSTVIHGIKATQYSLEIPNNHTVLAGRKDTLADLRRYLRTLRRDQVCGTRVELTIGKETLEEAIDAAREETPFFDINFWLDPLSYQGYSHLNHFHSRVAVVSFEEFMANAKRLVDAASKQATVTLAADDMPAYVAALVFTHQTVPIEIFGVSMAWVYAHVSSDPGQIRANRDGYPSPLPVPGRDAPETWDWNVDLLPHELSLHKPRPRTPSSRAPSTPSASQVALHWPVKQSLGPPASVDAADLIEIPGSQPRAWRTDNVLGDGRCQFEAFRRAVWGEDFTTQAVIEGMVAKMREPGSQEKFEEQYDRLDKEEAAHEGHHTLQEYVDGIANGENYWGNDLTLAVLGDMAGCGVVVVNERGGMVSAFEHKKSTSYVYLHYNGGHYENVLVQGTF